MFRTVQRLKWPLVALVASGSSLVARAAVQPEAEIGRAHV